MSTRQQSSAQFDPRDVSERVLVFSATPWFLRWGKGGFLIVAAAAWLAALGVSRSLKSSDLVLEDSGQQGMEEGATDRK